MQKLLDTTLESGFSSLPNLAVCGLLQVVCKSWGEAFLDFSAAIDAVSYNQYRSTGLCGVCKILPGISRLQISVKAQMHSLYLSPLSACSSLTSLCLENVEASYGVPSIDILLLPPQLRHLGIESYKVDPECYPHMKCTQLTQLSFQPPESLAQCKALELLEKLPKLQVRPSSCVRVIETCLLDSQIYSSQDLYT